MNQTEQANTINVPRNISLIYIILMKCMRCLLFYVSLSIIDVFFLLFFACHLIKH